MSRIQAIKTKLIELENLDHGCAVFGAARHRYVMNPVLAMDDLEQIETANQIHLSFDYKLILSELGNGGAGCGYGLEKLSLKHIQPPYPGTQFLLRNWNDPENIDIEMVDSDEISGCIKLFDYGCGIEYFLIVNGEEHGGIFYVDCDECFQKLKNPNLLDMYDRWLDTNLEELKRVQSKLHTAPLQDIVDSEWEQGNYEIKQILMSLMGVDELPKGQSGVEVDAFLEKIYRDWKRTNIKEED